MKWIIINKIICVNKHDPNIGRSLNTGSYQYLDFCHGYFDNSLFTSVIANNSINYCQVAHNVITLAGCLFGCIIKCSWVGSYIVFCTINLTFKQFIMFYVGSVLLWLPIHLRLQASNTCLLSGLLITPLYSNHFYQLQIDKRRRKIDSRILAGDHKRLSDWFK